MRAKESKRDPEDDRAVSPVIGVILMVAITVILAAVIGTFVLQLGDDVQANPQAGISFSNEAANTVEITINSIQRADKIQYKDDSGNWQDVGSSVGETATRSGLSDGETFVVRATYEENQAVIAKHEYSA
jgi:flagellin-like protein